MQSMVDLQSLWLSQGLGLLRFRLKAPMTAHLLMVSTDDWRHAVDKFHEP